MYEKFVWTFLFLIFWTIFFSFNSNQVTVDIFVKLIRKGFFKKLFFWSKTEALQPIFLKWWDETLFDQKNNAMTKTMKNERRKMRWNSKSRTNEYWNNYVETIQILNEVFRLLCRRCEINISHSVFLNIDKNSLRNHFNNCQCRLRKKWKYSSNENVKIMLKNVSFLSTIITEFYNKFVF